MTLSQMALSQVTIYFMKIQNNKGPTRDLWGGWAEVGRRNGIENQSYSSGRHTKFLNGIETTWIEIFIT